MYNNPNDQVTEAARREGYSSEGAPTAPVGEYTPPETPNPQSTSTYNVPPQPAQAVPPAGPAPNLYPPQISQQNTRWERHQHRGAPIVGPIILIGAGVVFLLNNLNVLPWGVWNQLWRLWPLILIAIGLDILVGRRNALASLLIVLLLVGGGVTFLALGGNLQMGGSLETADITIPLTSAKTSDVNVSLGNGNLTLDARANRESLMSGTFEYYSNRGIPDHNVNMLGDQAVLTLRQHEGNGFNFDFFGSGRTPDWTVHLNPNLPMTFKADLGAGNSTIDLSQSKASSVTINSGTGNSTIVFPTNVGAVKGDIDGGVGNLTVKIPEGLQARIDVDSGIGNITVDTRFTKQSDSTYRTSGYSEATNKLDLKLNVGIGNVEISR